MKQPNNGASNANLLWIVVAGVVLVGMIFAFNNLGKTQKIQAEDESETTEVTEDFQSSRSSRNSRFRGTRNSGISHRTRSHSSMSTATVRGFNEGKSGDMLRAAGDAFVYGLVTNEEGAALPGATIYALLSPITDNPTVLRTVTSDYQGSYTIEKLNDSSMRYTIVANAEGYAARRNNVTLRNEPQRLDFTLRKGISAQGIVLDKVTSEPIAGATVQIRDYYPLIQTKTGGDGRFVLNNIPANGRRNITAQKDGYIEMGTLGMRITRMMTNTMRRDEDRQNNEITLFLQQAGGTIRGKVVDLSNKPVAGARIKLDSNFLGALAYPGLRHANIITKEDGLFEAKDLPPDIDINISAVKGMEGEAQKFVLKPQEVRENVILTVPTSIFVSGKVIRADNRQPVPGTEIGYDGVSGRKNVIADEHGEFFFTTMTNDGQYRIYVDAECMVPSESDDISTTEVARSILRKLPRGSGSDNVTIRLISTPAIIGKVTTADGNPAKFATVQAAHETEDGYYSERTTTNHLGEYHFNLNEKIGGKRSIVFATARNGAEAKVVTRSKKRTTANLQLQNSRLSGRLYLSDESPLAGVTVSSAYIHPQSKILLETNRMVTSNNGRFSSLIGKEVDMVLRFHMPDGQLIETLIDSSQSAGKQLIFVYDPTSKTVSKRTSGGNNNRNGDRQNRGPQGGRWQNSGQNRGAPPR